jgi:hypothetical protein
MTINKLKEDVGREFEKMYISLWDESRTDKSSAIKTFLLKAVERAYDEGMNDLSLDLIESIATFKKGQSDA